MDFTNRGAQQSQARTGAPAGQPAAGGSHPLKKIAETSTDPRWVRVITVALLFSLTALAVCVAILFYTGNPSQAKYLNNKKFQAVFLNNGQVYFGSIKTITSKFFNLQNIYYLNSQSAQPTSSGSKSSSSSQQNDFSLVKLGCELHGPYDQMVINADQVTFWENLQDSGQVVKAITQWQQQNPNGQQCKTSSTSK